MIEGGEAGCCQDWDSCALVFVPVLLCHNQMHCCTPGKDWFYKPDLLPEAALGQLLWIYELSWVILFALTDEMFRQMMGLRNLCTSGPADAQRLWQQHQLCSPEGENEHQLVRGMKDEGFSGERWEGCSVAHVACACPWPVLMEVAPAFPVARAAGGRTLVWLNQLCSSVQTQKELFLPYFLQNFNCLPSLHCR